MLTPWLLYGQNSKLTRQADMLLLGQSRPSHMEDQGPSTSGIHLYSEETYDRGQPEGPFSAFAFPQPPSQRPRNMTDLPVYDDNLMTDVRPKKAPNVGARRAEETYIEHPLGDTTQSILRRIFDSRKMTVTLGELLTVASAPFQQK